MARNRVLVIGAGIIGSACAAALAEAGFAVTVIHDPARNTAEASGGHLLLQTKSPGSHLELARRSLELLQEQIRGHEAELGYRQTGSLILALDDEAEYGALEEHEQRMLRGGLPVQRLSGGEARKLEPALSQRIEAASYCSLDAQVEPVALREFMRRKASALGAAFVEGVVESLFISNDRPAARLCDQLLNADVMVLAAGAWSKKLAETLTGPMEIRPRRGLLLRAHAGSVLTSRPLLGANYLTSKFGEERRSSDFGGPPSFSLQQHFDGRLVLGGTREFAGFDWRVDPTQVQSVVACGARYVPAVSHLEWRHATVGYRPWTPAGVPYVCDCESRGLFLACGHEGDGITLAAVTAEIITEKVRAYLEP